MGFGTKTIPAPPCPKKNMARWLQNFLCPPLRGFFVGNKYQHMATNTAIDLSRISKIVGYKLAAGNFAASSPNLPISIAVLAEANNANQGSLDTTPKEIISAQQAGNLYGFGSPLYSIMRILRPISGSGVGGVKVFAYPQAEASGATARTLTIDVAGTAEGNGTHTLFIAGRTGLDGQAYDINIETGDTVAEIAGKIEDAVNAVLGCPFSATSTEYEATLTTKWRGLTAQEATVSVNTNNNALGLTYTVTQTQAGSGTPSVSAALTAFGSTWHPIVINGYSTQSTVCAALEAFNGRPDTDNPTGRYSGEIFKPFIALTGSTADNESTFTDARKTQCTIAICSAPLSKGFTFEAAANYALLFALKSQNTPHLDIIGSYLPDMPVPADFNIGTMAAYNSRDTYVKKGCTTVELVANIYKVCDFVTTYHPDGENPPQYRYCRNLMLDFNVAYGHFLLVETYVSGKAITSDDAFVTATNVIKPKQFKALLIGYADDLAARGLIAEPQFMKESISVTINPSNPDRFDDTFRYKRTGTARIVSTEGTAGFNFGTA